MPFRLSVHLPCRPVHRLCLEEGRPYLIGRDDRCGVIVDDERVSRRHASLHGRGDGWRLTDLGSRNDTWIDGQPLAAAGSIDRAGAAWLSFGGAWVRLEPVPALACRRQAEMDARRRRRVASLAARLGTGLTLPHLLDRTVAAALEVCGGERALLWWTRSNGELELARGYGVRDPLVDRELVAAATGQRRPQVRAAAPEHEVPGRRSEPFLACLPLVVPAGCVGALYVDGRGVRAGFSELDVELLAMLARRAASVLAETARLEPIL